MPRIDELPTAEDISDSDVLLLKRAAGDRKITVAAFLARILGVVPDAPGPSAGEQVGYAVTTSTETTSTTSAFPSDDTIPQNTEGAEYTQLATLYKPKYETSILLIDVYIPVTSANGNDGVIALFRDSVADALCAAKFDYGESNEGSFLHIRYSEVAGSTTERTYKVRYGCETSGTMYIGSEGTAARFGASRVARMDVTEIKQ